MIFQQNFTELEEMPWFRAIEEFSDAKNVSESKRDDDTDQEVLPRVIEKTVLPKITGIIRLPWKCSLQLGNETLNKSDSYQIMLVI